MRKIILMILVLLNSIISWADASYTLTIVNNSPCAFDNERAEYNGTISQWNFPKINRGYSEQKALISLKNSKNIEGMVQYQSNTSHDYFKIWTTSTGLAVGSWDSRLIFNTTTIPWSNVMVLKINTTAGVCSSK